MSAPGFWRIGFDWLPGGARGARVESDWGESLDRLPLALARLDTEGRLRQLNATWETLTGHSPRQGLGQPFARFLHPEDRVRWEQALQRLRGGQAAPVEVLRGLTRDGELRWVEVRLARDADGFVAGLADVTQQIRGRRSLQASHRSLTGLLDDLPMMVYRCRNNRLWSMEYVSAGCFALTGYAAESLIDSHELSYSSLIHPADREFVWAEVQAGLSSMQPFSLLYRLIRSDGSERRVQERGCGIYADNGEVLGLEGVVMEARG